MWVTDEEMRLEEEWEEAEDKRIAAVWEALDTQTRMDMFYSVVKKLYQGEVKERLPYRAILYDLFGFERDSYEMGMRCGFMALHNSIYTQSDIDDHKKYLAFIMNRKSSNG